ncbi:hypothetical protein QQG55_31715 [Brugia pahangi]
MQISIPPSALLGLFPEAWKSSSGMAQKGQKLERPRRKLTLITWRNGRTGHFYCIWIRYLFLKRQFNIFHSY